MVGQLRQKKHKTTKPIVDHADPSGPTKSNKAKLKPGDNEIATDEEDFSAVLNTLDHNRDLEGSGLKEKRKQTNGKYVDQRAWCCSALFLQVKHFVETFSPSRARSEFKRGNQSHTFK